MNKTIIVVGGFKDSQNGPVGGVQFASSTLVDSNLKETINWIKIDSTAEAKNTSIFRRSLRAGYRIMKVLFFLIVKPRVKTVLLFVSFGASFIEKGTMVFLSKLFGKKVILAPRSGHLRTQIDRSPVFKRLVIAVLDKADVIICQGNGWKEYFSQLSQKLKPEKFVVIYNWIEIGKYDFVRENRPVTGTTNLLYLGVLNREKGLLDLVAAMNIIKEKIQNFKIHIGGDGPIREELENLINDCELGQVFQLHGWVGKQEKMELLKKADFFILPSYAEGFPNSVLEAMASGIPVIVTQFGVEREIVPENTGIIVETGNTKALSEAIFKYYEDIDLRKDNGKRAKLFAMENFSTEIAVEKFKNLL